MKRDEGVYKEWIALSKLGWSMSKIARLYKCDRHFIRTVFNNLNFAPKTIFYSSAPSLSVFTKYVLKKDGCWGWCGRLNTNGYPVFNGDRTQHFAHRYSYIIHKGYIGDKFVCHTCDTPTCCNPDHLFLGSKSDNRIDCLLKNRSKSKLSVDVIKEIRKLLDSGVSNRVVSEMFKVSMTHVWRIKNRQAWSFL